MKNIVTRLKLVHTILIRPIERLFPLEIRSEDLPEIPQLSESRTLKFLQIKKMGTPEVEHTRSGREVKTPQKLIL